MTISDTQRGDDKAIPRHVCADVDGTVLATDLLYESCIAVCKRAPLLLFLIPFWLLRGRAYLKFRLAEAGPVAVDLLPLHLGVVEYLRAAAESGRTVWLASASHISLVQQLAERLGFVHGVIATVADARGGQNCKGTAKAEAIAARLTGEAWEYIGDSQADLQVWAHADKVTYVDRHPSVVRHVQRRFPGAQRIEVSQLSLATIIRAFRVYQWFKNLLVFLPLLLAHSWFDIALWGKSILAALSFSLCASSVYLINDLLDLEADRAHPRKSQRPCASGALSIQQAAFLAPLLLVAGFSLAMLVNVGFMGILGLYYLLTCAYSLRLKAIPLVDIILLALLYTIRIIAGGVATNLHTSQWLLGLSMFLFLSLACVKRFSELLAMKHMSKEGTKGRGYLVSDLEQIAIFGSASGYIAVLVLALYVSSAEVVKLYKQPQVIWFACPLLLYWISHLWLLARRGLVHDDPLVFALRDRVTYAVGVCSAIVVILAKLAILPF
jgi:4-hydroxybenzoate polyprenyltransferase/phosphoserine phosphatase